MTFEELYNRLLKSSVNGSMAEELDLLRQDGYDPHQLSCLLDPGKHPLVIRTAQCGCSDEQKQTCQNVCPFDALILSGEGNIDVDSLNCVGCGACIDSCKAKTLVENHDVLAALKAMRTATTPVYAMIAPAFINQYSEAVTPGKLRAAFKRIGFFRYG